MTTPLRPHDGPLRAAPISFPYLNLASSVCPDIDMPDVIQIARYSFKVRRRRLCLSDLHIFNGNTCRRVLISRRG